MVFCERCETGVGLMNVHCKKCRDRELEKARKDEREKIRKEEESREAHIDFLDAELKNALKQLAKKNICLGCGKKIGIKNHVSRMVWNKCPKCGSQDIEYCDDKYFCCKCKYRWEVLVKEVES